MGFQNGFQNRNKAFTLIELLVVIAIIGVMSSIVLASLRGTREKARIAKALQFSQSIYHTLGAYTVGSWRFDEGAGTIARDDSGYDNYGIFLGNPSWVNSLSPLGTALEFNGDNGNDDYVKCGPMQSFSGRQPFTLEAWIYPYDAFTQTLAEEAIIWWGEFGNAFGFNLDFLEYPSTRVKVTFFRTVSVATKKIKSKYVNWDEWYYLVGTYDGSELKFYLNGELVGTESDTRDMPDYSFPSDFFIGYNKEAYVYYRFRGIIDGVRIYDATF